MAASGPRRLMLALAAAMLATATAETAIAQTAAAIVLPGRAVTGADNRPASIAFLCTGNEGRTATGALSVVLQIPDVATLRPIFDFDPFEGPGATPGVRSHLSVGAGGAMHQGDFSPSGSIPGAPDTAFELDIAAAMRGDGARLASLSGLFRSFGTGPATIEWRQPNPRPRGAPLIAAFAISAANAARVAGAVAPCLAAAQH